MRGQRVGGEGGDAGGGGEDLQAGVVAGVDGSPVGGFREVVRVGAQDAQVVQGLLSGLHVPAGGEGEVPGWYLGGGEGVRVGKRGCWWWW